MANANAANNTAQTVVVIPNVDSNNAGTPLTWITENCQIGVSSGADVRLVLTADTGCTANPTVESNEISNDSSSYAHINIDTARTFADNTSSNINTYLKSNVGIEKDVTVTIESTGELCIGGTFGTGVSSQRPTGHVNGEYCQITMADNSSIVSNGGDINLYGYIKETSSNNGSSVIMNSGTMTEPLVFYDYYGGTHSLTAYSTVETFPLSTYDFPCCQVLSRFHCTSTLNGIGGMYASSKYYISQATLIASSSALFTITDGYIDIKYTPTSFGYTKTPDGTTTTQLTSYSTCELKSMTISVGSYSLNTADYYLPIPYNFDIEIASGILTISNKVKFLTGSSLTIDSGATAVFSANVIFYQAIEGYIYNYVHNGSKAGNNLAAASLINNGTLTINSGFAGIVDTTASGATTTTGSSFSNNLKETESAELHQYSSLSSSRGTVKWFEVAAYAGIYISEDSSASPVLMASNSTFTSVLGNNRGYWETDSTTGDYTEEKTTEYSKTVGGLCILPGTLITMADDTYKRAIDVRPGDLVWAFNHETGRFEKTVIILNPHLKAGANLQDVLRITMESGRKIGIVNEHGFFCVEENKYVYVNAHNYTEYIGKHFISVDPITKELIRDRVVDITLTREVTKISAPATAMHINIVSADILSLEGGVAGCFNIFEFDPDTLKYDEEKMKADIEKYGLLTVEDYNGRVPDFFFDILPFKYFAISVGKGLTSYETIDGYIEKYVKELVEGKKNY